MAIITSITGRQPDEAEHARRRHLRTVMRALLDHDQPETRQTGGPVIMNDDQAIGADEAATSTVSPYETVA